MLMEGDHQRAWRDGEARITRLVFIGRNLPKEIIIDGFNKCRLFKQGGRVMRA